MEQILGCNQSINLNEGAIKRLLKASRAIVNWVDSLAKNLLIAIFIPSEVDRKIAEQKDYARDLSVRPYL